MSRLRTEVVKVRGEDFTIREWTPVLRKGFLERLSVDKFLSSVYLAYHCTLAKDGKLFFKSEDQLAYEEPVELADELTRAVLKLGGGFGDDEETVREKKD